MTTIKLSGGDLGGDEMLVRCNLSEASSPVEVDYRNDEGDGFVGTQYQCADASHRVSGLVAIAKRIAAQACEMPEESFECDWEEVVTVQ